MNVFVTGGAGYIGSICTEELLNAGHQVTVFDNLSEGHRSAVDPRAAFVQGDLANYAEVSAALKDAAPEAVLHVAAASLVPESMVNPSKYFRNNVANGINLLDAMDVMASAVAAFDEKCVAGFTVDDEVNAAHCRSIIPLLTRAMHRHGYAPVSAACKDAKGSPAKIRRLLAERGLSRL